MGMTLPEVEPLPASVSTVFAPGTCLQRAYCTVSVSPVRKPEPHRVYYEVHGSSSPEAPKLVFIMGLNNSSFGWISQVEYFGKREYQVLVLDNRGVGWSDTPAGAYSTEEMAQDVVEVLNHLGWTSERMLSVVGVSMGGMIALQLARLVPERLLALVLTSTQAGDRATAPTMGSLSLFSKLLYSNALFGPEATMKAVAESLYPKSYLEEKDPRTGQKRQVGLEKDFLWRAQQTNPQTTKGKLGQLAAVSRHRVTAEQLAEIESSVPKIGIVTGDQDKLINPKRSQELSEMMPKAEFWLVKNAGHALPSQIATEYNEWIEKLVREAIELSSE